jgi:NAD(P)-dependent dehydrogenase (short-subunit alcohol dehydrogenase family)
MTIKKLAGKVAVLIGGWRGIAAVLVKHLAADGADVASVFVTNGGCAGVQQVLRLWRPHGRKPHPSKVQLTPDSDRGTAIDTRTRQGEIFESYSRRRGFGEGGSLPRRGQRNTCPP